MSRPDFQAYLRSLTTAYEQWWELYTLTDAVGKEKIKRQTEQSAFPFDFGLMVQTVKPQSVEDLEDGENREKPAEKLERLPVLEGVRKYAAEHVLLLGRPGSGKSTALIRLLLEEAATQRDAAARIPVLVELRYWQTGVCDRILAVLHQHDPALELDLATLKAWLRQGRLLLLMDGLNELPSEAARREVATFRQDYAQTPMIFTTRELSVGGDLGIAKKLEMQPLTETQMQAFVKAYLPLHQAEQMLRQLKERLREFGQTPLWLWMLCGVISQTPNAKLPTNLGGVFKAFTNTYEVSSVRVYEVAALKGDVKPLSDRRLWSKSLNHLAFKMMQGETPVDFRVVISRHEAENILNELFKQEVSPSQTARDCLDDLLNYHLLQIKTGDEIEFRHQLIQEYYAAEYLLRQLPKLSDVALQRHYLNYLKWTEPIALMLALVEDEAQAVRVVELAIDVDLMLGARSAGEVRQEFQSKTVSLITDLNVPPLLKIGFLKATHSEIVISALIKALEHPDSYVRRSAVEALGKLNSEQAIPALIKALEHPDSYVRRSAVEALGKLNSEQVIPALIKALEHPDSYVRRSAVEALGKLNSEQVIPALIKALEDPDSGVREGATQALGKLNSEQAIPALIKALEDPDSYVCGRATQALGKLNSKQVIPALIKALEDPDSGVCERATQALCKLNSEQAIPALIKALEDPDSGVCERAAEALGNLNSEQAIPALIKALEDPSWNVREKAAEALGKFNSEQGIPALIKALEDPGSYVRERATQALGKLNSEQAIPALIKALEHPDSYVRRSAVEALGKLNSEQVIPALIKALEHPDSYVRRSAVEALGKLNSEQVIPALIKALEDPNWNVRERAADALGKFNSEQVILALIKTLEDLDSDVRWRAVEALGRLNSEQAIPALIKALEDPNWNVRERAADALGILDHEPMIPGLLNALQNPDSVVRRGAADALGNLNLNSEQAIPALIKTLEDPHSDVRRSGAEALGKIGHSKLLEDLWEVHLSATSLEAYSAIATIQSRCKFYNYEIFQAAQAIDSQTTNREERAIVYHIDTVGNLNTGTVNVKGDQIGTQHNSDKGA